MHQTLVDLAHVLSVSPFGPLARSLLRNVRGFAPIIQTVHILGVTVVMGSIVLVDLKLLGLALPSQASSDLARRLVPWTWWALLVLAASGLVQLFARPERYLLNPVFGVKFALLLPAIILTLAVQRASARAAARGERSRIGRWGAKLAAAGSLVLWVGVAMAGRWIAYADYLFPQ